MSITNIIFYYYFLKIENEIENIYMFFKILNLENKNYFKKMKTENIFLKES